MVPRTTALGGDPRGRASWPGSGAGAPALSQFGHSRLTRIISRRIISHRPRKEPPTMPLESIETAELSLSDTRWQARVDLAAAHRLAVMHGFHEGIFNHLTLRVPGANNRYYQIPFGLHWSEVTASCFMEVGYDEI